MSYFGIFFRHAPGDTPRGPGGGGLYNSPDILASPNPIADPASPISATGYANDAGSNTLLVGQQNFIYVRGLNVAPQPATTRIWLFWTRPSQVMNTQAWSSDGIEVHGQPGLNYTTVTAQSNQVVLTNPPFMWTPPPAPAGENGYVLIAMAEMELSDPPVSPVPPPFTNGNIFAEYVATSPELAIRAMASPVAANPTWQFTSPLAGAGGAGQIYLGIQCNNVPTDGFVAFSAPGPDVANTINVPKTAVTAPNWQFLLPVTYPPGFNTAITVSYWQGATAPPPGASITPMISIPAAQGDGIGAAKGPARMHIIEGATYQLPR